MQSIFPALIVLGLIVWGMYRRMRAQPVRPANAIVAAAVITIVSALGVVGANRLAVHTVAIVLGVPALLIGLGGGYLLVRSIHFWRDADTGVLWMKGGIVYLVVWLGTLAIRIAVEYASGSMSSQSTRVTHVNATLATVSVDLVIVSVGLWVGRAIALVRAAKGDLMESNVTDQ